ncbi:MAG: ABC transporter substrate-binding protein [Dehalococcoidia bacterium]
MTRLSRRRLMRGAGMTAAGMAFLAACGGDGESTDEPSSGAATTSAGTQAAAAATEGKPGGTIRWVMIPVDPTSFDPYADFNYQSHLSSLFYYSRLYRFRTQAGNPNSFWEYEVEPDAALSLPEISDDGQTYVIKLRPDVKWHNLAPMDGRQVTAEDIKFDMEFFMQNAQSSDVFTGVIDKVEAPDPTTVSIKLKFPYVALSNLLAAPHYFFILPPEILQRDGNVKNTHVGSGPFLFDTYEPGVRLVYKKNPEYYGTPYPYVDVAEGFIVNDPRRTLSLFQSDQIGFMSPTQEDLPTLKQSKPDASILEYLPNAHTFFFYFGDSIPANKPPFNDVRVRQALSLVVDRDGFADLFYEGKGVWNNVISPGMSKWYLDPTSDEMGAAAQWFEYDAKKAKQLLSAAGYSDDFEIEFHYSPGYGRTFASRAEGILALLKEGGFNVKPVAEEYGNYIANTFAGKFSGTAMGPQTDLTEPDLLFFRMFSPDNQLNNSRVNDPKMTEMLNAQRREFDEDKRKQIVYDIQRYNAEMMYYVPGVQGYSFAAVQPSVKDYRPTVAYGFADTITWLWNDS